MSILYPVAETAEQALHAPRGRAAREREAERIAGGGVAFVQAFAGPVFSTRAAAEQAYAGKLDQGFARLIEVMVDPAPPPARRRPVKPVFKNGRRWPAPPAHPPAVGWRVSVGFWRIAAGAPETLEPARQLRRDPAAAEHLNGRGLQALAAQPLRPVKPQQPLDIGLFETRPPEAPHIVMPDE